MNELVNIFAVASWKMSDGTGFWVALSTFIAILLTGWSQDAERKTSAIIVARKQAASWQDNEDTAITTRSSSRVLERDIKRACAAARPSSLIPLRCAIGFCRLNRHA